jgi:NAD(P)-dependent dehydrogenase (short-subunit alcohol dehydrogenase family)
MNNFSPATSSTAEIPVSTKMSLIAIVTGGGSGIGAAVGQALAADGWTVVLAGRRREALEAVMAAGSGLTGALDAIPTDVTDEASVRDLFKTTVERYGRVDLLFNNAGVGAPPVDIDVLELELWSKVVAVNLTGVHVHYKRRVVDCKRFVSVFCCFSVQLAACWRNETRPRECP